MVLAQWFLGPLGQFLAPDPHYDAESDPANQRSPFWDTVAPDARFTAARTDQQQQHAVNGTAAPAAAAATAVPSNSAATPLTHAANALLQSPAPHPHPQQGQFTTPQQPPFTPCSACQQKLCSVCQKNATPASTPATKFQTPEQQLSTPSSSSATPFSGLQSPRNATKYTPNKDVCDKVLQANVGTAERQVAGGGRHKTAGNVFRLCSSNAELNDELKEKLRKHISKDPSLLNVRSCNMGNMCPDGLTPFLAAVNSGNQGAVDLIWGLVDDADDDWTGISASELLEQRSMTGQTAYHIAASKGHTETLLPFLRAQYTRIFGQDAVPRDLLGRTPLASAITSPDVKAKRNKAALVGQLFSPKDPSVLGNPRPPIERVVEAPQQDLQFTAGTAEMPGRRSSTCMEDYTVAQVLPPSSLQQHDGAVLLAVCDGHSDGGQIAQLVGENLVTVFDEEFPPRTTTAEVWRAVCHQACLTCDDEVREAGLKTGGAVAVFVIVTKTQIVVTNVGDCRCILVQSQPEKGDAAVAELTQAAAQISLEDGDRKPPAAVTSGGDGEENAWANKFSVMALSNDHKPDNETEVRRIENAGLQVMSETFTDDRGVHTIHKVALSDENRMACSRSFGDFEYKTKKELSAEEQAVTAAPEVVVHDRSSRDAFLVAACDGVWDVMSNEEVAAFVTSRIEHYRSSSSGSSSSESAAAPLTALLPTIGDELLIECLNRKSGDNMSVVVAALSDWAETVRGISSLQAKQLFA